MIKRIIKTALSKLGVHIMAIPPTGIYCQSGMASIHNHDFVKDPRFLSAYNRGVLAAGADYNFHWRVYIALWVAQSANRLSGDFVECGVNRGALSSAIMDYLDWNKGEKHFYLLDTYSGLDERYVSDEEKGRGALKSSNKAVKSGFYVSGVDSVKENFSEWKNVHIIQGSVPDTLTQVDSGRIAYLHIDMNCSAPEVAAIECFWPKMTPGGMVLLDDYAFIGYELSKKGMDEFAAKNGIEILSLPTGQGLLVKSPK